ncbi:MAG: hypothetical protein M1434_08355 [Chloroflexi bacterium]|nr:hypothetical protein [Chloroflexota bacterium]
MIAIISIDPSANIAFLTIVNNPDAAPRKPQKPDVPNAHPALNLEIVNSPKTEKAGTPYGARLSTWRINL